jgi:hypothetical protein
MRDALVHKNAVNLYQAGTTIGRTERKLPRAFDDLQLGSRSQSIVGAKRLRENHSAELV